jgi:hypothetical protein
MSVVPKVDERATEGYLVQWPLNPCNPRQPCGNAELQYAIAIKLHPSDPTYRSDRVVVVVVGGGGG